MVAAVATTVMSLSFLTYNSAEASTELKGLQIGIAKAEAEKKYKEEFKKSGYATTLGELDKRVRNGLKEKTTAFEKMVILTENQGYYTVYLDKPLAKERKNVELKGKMYQVRLYSKDSTQTKVIHGPGKTYNYVY
ncbi:TPA: chemotaxis protein [Staphylococcus aureus]|nr:chemotaxis protein [Staphylococcus aureus]HDD0325714.1 chemotaxis protein [Staphylococcus aureus]HDD0484648.1 chemotaxis protein [Staphylococcus aureus]HDD0598593.1 chemotaxis protein [Staphylococcus aureus]